MRTYYKTTDCFETYGELKEYLNKLFIENDIVAIKVWKKRDTGEWLAEYRDQTCVSTFFRKEMKKSA